MWGLARQNNKKEGNKYPNRLAMETGVSIKRFRLQQNASQGLRIARNFFVIRGYPRTTRKVFSKRIWTYRICNNKMSIVSAYETGI